MAGNQAAASAAPLAGRKPRISSTHLVNAVTNRSDVGPWKIGQGFNARWTGPETFVGTPSWMLGGPALDLRPSEPHEHRPAYMSKRRVRLAGKNGKRLRGTSVPLIGRASR